MTWIYYGSQLQFLNTLVRLVSNIFPSQRDRDEERAHRTVISWGWMGRGVGKAMPEHVSLHGAQTFLMDYLSWKYSTWKILPQGALCQPEGTGSYDEATYACYVGLRVELPGQVVGVTKSVLLNFYNYGSSVDLQGSKKVSLWQLFWWASGRIEQTPVKVSEKCCFHFVISLLWALGLVAWRGGSSCLEICIIPPTEHWPPSLGRCQLRLECPPIAPFEFWPKLRGWRWTWPYHMFCPFQVQAEMLLSFGA